MIYIPWGGSGRDCRTPGAKGVRALISGLQVLSMLFHFDLQVPASRFWEMNSHRGFIGARLP